MQENLISNSANERYLRKLFDLSKRLITSLDLDTILQATVEGVATLSGLDTAAVYLLEDGQFRLCNATPPLPPEFPEEMRYTPINDYPHLRTAIDSSSPLFIQDTQKIVMNAAESTVVQMRNLRTLLFLPLIAETEAMGALIVGSIGTPTSISDMESDLAFTLANFAALAVKNARLYRTGQKYAAELEQTLAERKKAEVEREKLRQQLVQTQKMDAIGQLAGGIAHDFNNMLSGIIGNAELVYNSTSDSALREYAGDIITIGKRSAELTTQLLAFSRKGQVQNSTVDLHKVLQEIASILRHTISRNITIKTEFEADNFHTRGDPTQIQSALLNLAVNARDAMFQGGVIEFRTRCTMPDVKQWPLCTFELKPETYIEITVRDNGIGMSAETLEHIYEPFFTTKSQGEGTGLGLSAVYGTMKSHQGAICVESSPGQGTTFRLYFPLEQKIDTAERESEPLKESSFSGGNSIANSQKRILIIDDEEMVAKAAAGHLRKAGFEVILFTDSTECLDFFKDSHPTISLVILDIIMPKMDGKELFYALKAINPDLPVILSSGFSVNGTAQTLLDDGAQLFIPKPFQREDLLHAIDKVLG